MQHDLQFYIKVFVWVKALYHSLQFLFSYTLISKWTHSPFKATFWFWRCCVLIIGAECQEVWHMSLMLLQHSCSPPPANTDHDLTQLVAASAWCFWWAVNNANLMVSGNYGKNKHQKQKLWIIICNNSMTNKIEHLPIQSKQPFSVLRRLAKLAGVKQTLSKIGGRISKVGKQGLVNPAVTLMGSTTTDTRHSVD